ncbi:MAG: adenosylmethionine decarboxylase [Spirochaetota bacterium]
MNALGRQILVEFYDCDDQVLNDKYIIDEIMREAAELSGATIVTSTFHNFSPFGVSGVVVIAESHVAIHTWPEYGYAAVDVFTCGRSIDPWKIKDYLKNALKSRNQSVIELKRGELNVKGNITYKVSSG